MGSQKAANFIGQLIVLRGTEEPTVGHGLEYVQLCIDPAGTQLPVHPNGVGQKQISGSSLKERRRERGGEIAEQWRKIRVSEIVFARVQSDGVSKALRQHAVETEICVEGIAGLGQVDFRGQQDECRRKG
jgi:hypothetical protein